MTQDEIIEMAREAGVEATGNEYWPFFIEELEAFAKLVAEKAFQNGYEKGVAAFNDAILLEREACAKLCDEYGDEYGEFIADVIRSRGQA